MSHRHIRWGVVVAFAALACVACGPPECRPSPVHLPSAPDTLDWVGDGYATVEARTGEVTLALLLDTGFSQTAIRQSLVTQFNLAALELDLGATHVGPMIAGLLAVDGIDGVIGAETLHQLPLRFDARARTTDILAGFEPAIDGAADLIVLAPNRCRNDAAPNGPADPFAFLVQADIEGTPVTLILDTGASATFIRSDIFDTLTQRPTLSNLRIGSGFSGAFVATATRARTFTVGNGTSENQLVIAAPEVDAELDRLGALFDQAKPASMEGPLRMDGFLGWTFLREFKVSLAEGASATNGRTLSLERFDTQTHWRREFQGIGIYRVPSGPGEPSGIKVDGFLSNSPARDVGMREGDIITKVNGEPVGGFDPIVFTGLTATFEVQRNEGDAANPMWTTMTFTVAWRDLLPDP
ncbi:MAG: aspartyl protease family protein [Myxococcaceae bacterium]|nr:aspartyl protease family protein [Myxococcaceae bacterium]